MEGERQRNDIVSSTARPAVQVQVALHLQVRASTVAKKTTRPLFSILFRREQWFHGNRPSCHNLCPHGGGLQHGSHCAFSIVRIACRLLMDSRQPPSFRSIGVRCKYYFAWKLGEAACNAAGAVPSTPLRDTLRAHLRALQLACPMFFLCACVCCVLCVVCVCVSCVVCCVCVCVHVCVCVCVLCVCVCTCVCML